MSVRGKIQGFHVGRQNGTSFSKRRVDGCPDVDRLAPSAVGLFYADVDVGVAVERAVKILFVLMVISCVAFSVGDKKYRVAVSGKRRVSLP